MRTDPTDTGGMFVSRRPGTRPVHYRELPERGDEQRQRLDGVLAAGLLVLMAIVNLCFWGPLPAACLWVGGHAQWLTNSVGVGLLAAFALLIAGLLLGLMLLKRLDSLWILVRRAAGHDQREGVIGKIFMLCCMVGVPAFTIWFVLFSGAELAGVSVTQFTGGG